MRPRETLGRTISRIALSAALPAAALSLFACAPAASRSPDLPVVRLEDRVLNALVAPLEETIASLGITVVGGEAYRYDGQEDAAFPQAVNRLYRDNPGFCPLEEAFYPAPSGTRFMTVLARGKEVRLFVYEQAERPKLTFAYLRGMSDDAVPAVACRMPGE
jgi:hypothetical protein